MLYPRNHGGCALQDTTLPAKCDWRTWNVNGTWDAFAGGQISLDPFSVDRSSASCAPQCRARVSLWIAADEVPAGRVAVGRAPLGSPLRGIGIHGDQVPLAIRHRMVVAFGTALNPIMTNCAGPGHHSQLRTAPSLLRPSLRFPRALQTLRFLPDRLDCEAYNRRFGSPGFVVHPFGYAVGPLTAGQPLPIGSGQKRFILAVERNWVAELAGRNE